MDDDHLINVFMDITATKEAQLKQQKLLEELQRSNTNLEEFAYAASHDLKEPIRKVLFFSDRIKSKLEGRMDTEDQRLFERLENATRRMESLVDDLLAFSQVSQTPRQMGTVDLNMVIARVLEDLELEIMEKKAVIHCHSLASVQGFARQLQQLFLNLLGNALKYIKPGATPEIWIECSRIKGQDIEIRLDPSELASQFFCIEVRDNGIGFDSKDAERIFNVFTRLHGNTEFRGTGIGLSIARRVVQNHGGYITAESEPDHGAKFRVFLPC
jgi:signal transduction histidine kinase